MTEPRPFEARIEPDGVVRLSGELDLATADILSQTVASCLDGQQPVLDFSQVTFVDSTGIRAILQLAHAKGRTVVLRNLPLNVRKVLEIAGVNETVGVRIES
jgi:anti-anti-sigma factor